MNPHQSQIADHLPFTWVDGPGNRVVLFFQGCNFDCVACHNPQTIPQQSVHAQQWSLEDALQRIRASMPYISGVTVSGGEATLQYEFLVALFSAIRNDPALAHLTTFIDSNGFATREIWDALAPVTDGVMIDLKVLDDSLHRSLTGQSNALVLQSIRHLAEIGLLYETRLMLVPDVNDSDLQLRETGAWLMQIDPDMRVKLNHFHAHGARAAARQWAEADEARKARNRAALTAAGVLRLC